MVFSKVWSVVRQLVGFKGRKADYVSDNGRGIVERSGQWIVLRRVVRGLSIELDNGKRVTWQLAGSSVDWVIQTLQCRGLLVVNQADLNGVDVNGTSIHQTLQDMVESGHVVCTRYPNRVEVAIADSVAITVPNNE